VVTIALYGQRATHGEPDAWSRRTGQTPRNFDNYFSKANVVIPVDPLNPNPFGNAGRNTVRSSALYATDLGLHKDFSSSICSTRRIPSRPIPR
jgi:hypothetical protein